MVEARYKRVLIKISGEVLAGNVYDGKRFGIDIEFVRSLCLVIKMFRLALKSALLSAAATSDVKDGGGKIERSRSDHMGMLATTINALAIADVLEKMDVEVRVQTAVDMRAFAEPYVRLRACRHLEKGRVVIFAAGTGNPYFSTDTAAVLRAAEIDADIILLAKNVDGIYDDDPNTNPNAKRYNTLSYAEVLRKQLKAMDTTATSLSMVNNIPILLFALDDPENIYRV